MTYLQPTSVPPAQGQALNRLVQPWISGIMGSALDPTLIRPYTQSEPPVIPDKGTPWMAFWVRTEGADKFPFVRTLSDGTGSAIQRQEDLSMLCSFYDNGVSGQAQMLASLMRDGTAIPDNREGLTAVGVSFVDCEPETTLPTLLNETYFYRVDLPIRLRRQIDRTYDVPNIETAVGTVNYDTGLPPTQILVENPNG